MSDQHLFNCCRDGVAPDWRLFESLETGGCVDAATDSDSSLIIGGVCDAEAEFWTVYGRLKDGGCEAITDCATRAEVDAAAMEISRLSKLPIHLAALRHEAQHNYARH